MVPATAAFAHFCPPQRTCVAQAGGVEMDIRVGLASGGCAIHLMRAHLQQGGMWVGWGGGGGGGGGAICNQAVAPCGEAVGCPARAVTTDPSTYRIVGNVGDGGGGHAGVACQLGERGDATLADVQPVPRYLRQGRQGKRD